MNTSSPEAANSILASKPTAIIMRRTIGAAFGALLGTYAVALILPPKITPPNRPPAPAQNGFPLLVAATAKTCRDEDVNRAIDKAPRKTVTLEEKQALVAVNLEAIEQAQEALRYPYYAPVSASDVYGETPHYARYRQMARLLVLAANVAWEEGDQNRAVTYYEDCVTMGRKIPHHVGLMGGVVGLACETIGRRRLWKHVDQMNEEAASLALARLQALTPERYSYSQMLGEEKYLVVMGTKRMMENPDRLQELLGTDASENGELILYSRLVPRRFVANTMGRHIDRLIAQSNKPYISNHEELPVPKEVFTQIMVPVFSQARCRFVVNETGDNLLRTALAIRIYRLRRGSYPESLSELVAAKIIDAVPEDPFALPGTPLRYTRQPDGKYCLYSLGPDGVDNGGKGIDNNAGQHPASIDPIANQDSKGDMVAGWYGY